MKQASLQKPQNSAKAHGLAIRAKGDTPTFKVDRPKDDVDRFERGRSPTVRGLISWSKLTPTKGATVEHIEYKLPDAAHKSAGRFKR